MEFFAVSVMVRLNSVVVTACIAGERLGKYG